VEAAGGRATRERSDGGGGREVEGVRVGGWERWRKRDLRARVSTG
jgi:hypothetical protein